MTPATGRLPRTGRGFALAVLATLAAPAVATWIGVAGGLEERPGSAALLLVAALVATVAGGIWFGLAAALVSYFAFLYYFVEPVHSLMPRGSGIVPLAAFALSAVLVTFLLDREQRARADVVDAHAAASAAAAQMEGLQRLAALLSAAATPTQIAQILVSEGSEAVGATAGWVSVLSEDTRELEHLSSLGYDESFVDDNRLIQLDGDHIAAEVARTGEPLWLEVTSDAARPELQSAHRATGTEALALVPLKATDEPLGFMALRFPGQHEFTAADRELLLTFARQASEAIQRARLFDAERQARRIATVLQSITASLSAAAGRSDVASVIVDQTRDALDADACYLSVGVGAESTLAGHTGQDLLRADELSATAARALEARDVVVSDSDDERASVCVPLMLGESVFGTLAVVFAKPLTLGPPDYRLLERIARECARALERADLYQREWDARRSTQLATERLSRLQTMTAALATAVSVEDVAEIAVAQGAGTFGAAAAAVHLLSEADGALVLTAERGYPAALTERLQRIAADEPLAGAGAVRRGRILWFASNAALERRYPAYAGARGAWEAVGFIPLVGREGPLGLLTLDFEERRPRHREDRALLGTIGRQCGQAVERARLYDDEQTARAAAQRANERLRTLEAVAQVGLAARTLEELIENLLPLVRTLFGADRAALLLVDEERQELRMRAAVGVDEEIAQHVRIPIGQGIAGRIAESGTASRIDDVLAAEPASDYLRAQGGSLLGVPLRADGRVTGVLHVSSDRLGAFEDRDLRLLALAGDRIALALERISLYEREHETAVTLQRSVLPEHMPELEGVRLAARYVPGSAGVRVGGDWYDAIELNRGRVGIVVGDVVGKGVLAAATMTQLRNALRVYATEGLKPATVLTKLNRLADTTGPSFATLLYAVVDTVGHSCRYASAGHPPPLLVRADGPTEFLEGGRSIPIGVQGDVEYRQDVTELEPGDVLVLYTDGLVERRGSSLDEGLEQLRSAACEGPDDLEALLDHLVGELLGGQPPSDDVALLALRMAAEPAQRLRRSFPAEPAALAQMRSSLRDWLTECHVPDAVVQDVVLASSEACANAVEHAEDPTRSEFEVIAERVGDEIVVRVRDYGQWREPREDSDRGFGLQLIERMVDAVEINRNAGGTEVELRRRGTTA